MVLRHQPMSAAPTPTAVHSSIGGRASCCGFAGSPVRYLMIIIGTRRDNTICSIAVGPLICAYAANLYRGCYGSNNFHRFFILLVLVPGLRQLGPVAAHVGGSYHPQRGTAPLLGRAREEAQCLIFGSCTSQLLSNLLRGIF